MKFLLARPLRSFLIILLLSGGALFFSREAFATAGGLDGSFTPGAGANLNGGVSNIAAMAIQPDGRIVIGGDFSSYDNIPRSRIARVNANGSLDGTFDPGSGADGVVRCVVRQPDGKILMGGAFSSVGGFSRDSVARLNVNGSVDTTFTSPGFDDGLGTPSSVYTIALQPNGKIIVGGYFPGVGGIQEWSITRLNADGSRDNSFTPGTTLRQAIIHSVAIQPDGKILAAGQIQSANNNTIPEDDIVRLNANGSLDTSFGLAMQGFSSGFIRKVVVQSDGRVLIGGGTFTINGGSQFYDVARLNTDGTFDNTFSVVTAGYPGGVYDLDLRSDSSVYIVGGFTSVNGVTRKSIARLTVNGGVDPNFDPGIGPISSNNNNPAVLALAVQVDNRVLIGGYFSSVDNLPRNNIARLLGDEVPPTPTPAPTATPPTPTPSPSATPTPVPTRTVENLNDDGPGSLRQAIAASVAGDIIGFSISGTITLKSGELMIDRNLTIAGPGSGELRISRDSNAAQSFRILEISANTTAYLSGLTVSGGRPADVAGGGIFNNGALTLDDVRIEDNHPVPSGFPVQNIVDGGGCLNSSGATLVMTSCSITGNNCNGNGGGILNDGDLTVINSTIWGNAAGYGGGIFSTGMLRVTNCTVSGNGADSTGAHGLQGGYGGGLFITGFAELISDTISANGCVWHGGGISVSGNSVKLTNCLLAANTSQSNPQDADIDGKVQSEGHNLVGISLGQNGFGPMDLIGTPDTPLDPKLGTLQDNGGLTLTMALLPSSPAIDQGLNAIPTAGDQRNMPRTYNQSGVRDAAGGDGTDIGAFELESRVPTFGNISTRLRVGTGDSALIGGFIITGTHTKTVIVRGIGPSLGAFGIQDALADPVIDVYDSSGVLRGTNDNWNDALTRQEIIDSGLAPTNDLESALWGVINPGPYTVVVRGKDDSTGVGLFEVYDLDRTVDSKLANISTRGFVDTGDNALIGGTIIVGSTSTKVLIRAVGPSLTNLGVPNALQDPTLELYDNQGNVIISNDNWRATQETEIIGTTIPPTDDRESAILANLQPGQYTAIVRGKDNSTGVAVVEAYQLQ